MSYMALYRKFRPDEFEDVKGQDAIVRTLKSIRWMEALVGNARPAAVLRQALP